MSLVWKRWDIQDIQDISGVGVWGCAKFVVDWEQTKLRQMGLKVLSWLFLGPVKGVLDWGTGEWMGHGVGRGSWWMGRGKQAKGQSNARVLVWGLGVLCRAELGV